VTGPTCTCPADAGSLLRAHLAGTAEPCPSHNPAPAADTPEPLPLNDFDGLRSAIDRALGTTTTQEEA
jgi:hypothetical protein